MLIVNQSSGVADSATDFAASSTVQTFNKQFQGYLGTQKGSSVKTLLSQIATNNKNNSGEHKIKVTCTDASLSGTDDGDAIAAGVSSIKNSKKYTVTQTAMDSEGYIIAITIS